MRLYFSLAFCFLFLSTFAQDTFSIVAVDSISGEVGGAGATCLDVNQEGVSVLIINDIIPGKGVIHTQSFWNASNQNRARNRMLQGDSPEEIMDYLVNNDVENNSTIRQYGAADLDNNNSPRAAAFTGVNCFEFKGQRVGTNYAIQGNILLGAQVLDSMEQRFLRTEGSLAERLMAAMQGAKIPGADSRCLAEGVSSRSAFLRVAKPNDSSNNLYLDLEVPATPVGEEPIDELQALYDDWRLVNSTGTNNQVYSIKVFPNPAESFFQLQLDGITSKKPFILQIYNQQGKVVLQQEILEQSTRIALNGLPANGAFWLTLKDDQNQIIYTNQLIRITHAD